MSGQSIVITGASKGIGRATAIHLAQKGFRVFAGVRKPVDGEALKQAAGNNLIPIIIDVVKEDTIIAAAQQVQQAVGSDGLYGLVNNAGVAVAAPLEFLPLEELREQLEINVIGQLAVTQAFLPLIRQAKGRIVNITSIAGIISGSMVGA
ncbi:MAG: SDR family NAD(P)-dependent oxidoreductase, partial [Anaerolineae bacterium]|nr:SDR family NAD(P)-dependent oxidoreductase [Anaerolineae bacterium]